MKSVPRSISETSYWFREYTETVIPFSVLCFVSALFIWPLWIKLTPDGLQFLVFIVCGSIMFVGCTPLYRREFESEVHYTCGILAFVSGLAWLLIMKQYVPLCTILGLSGLWTALQPSRYTFIFEVISYVVICITLIFNYL